MSKRLKFVVCFIVLFFVINSAFYFLLGYSDWWLKSLFSSIFIALVADIGYVVGNAQGRAKGYDIGHCTGYEEGYSIGYSTAKNRQQESNKTT